jgi:coenzyme F420-0:L-glutamate ligase/coenzyme F420-1:gamma-L-glutamate ligase
VLSALALSGLPEVAAGDDLTEQITRALTDHRQELLNTDVLVIAHKVVSKAEGRVRSLSEVEPGAEAMRLAEQVEKDPRAVQLILEESRQVLRAVEGVLICVTRHGLVCANAGVDASNVPGEGTVLLLPEDPDASARQLRRRLRARTGLGPAILITDSFGRAWRNGQSEVAIGCAGLVPLDDWRGRADSLGRELRATWIAVADELAAAADLARAKDSRQPVVVVRGASRYVTEEDGPGAAALMRPEAEDLFR